MTLSQRTIMRMIAKMQAMTFDLFKVNTKIFS